MHLKQYRLFFLIGRTHPFVNQIWYTICRLLWFIYAIFKLLNWFSCLSLLDFWLSACQIIYNFIIGVFVIARIICEWVLSSARTLIKITNHWRLDSLIFNHTFRFIYQSLSNLSCSFPNINCVWSWFFFLFICSNQISILEIRIHAWEEYLTRGHIQLRLRGAWGFLIWYSRLLVFILITNCI